MNMKKMYQFMHQVVVLWLLMVIFAHAGQTSQAPKRWEPKTFPGFPHPIQLLPGYKAETTQGMEGLYGKIWKDGGLTIEFALGTIPGGMSEGEVIWEQKQIINGQEVISRFTNKNDFDVLFPYLLTIFHAKVRNQQDVAEMLLIALTYNPPPVNLKPKKR